MALEVGREKTLASAGHMTNKHAEFVGCIRSHTINKTSKMAGRPEFLPVLRRVGFSLSKGIFSSLNFKPFQVKCLESILKGQDVIGVLPAGSGKSMLFHGCIALPKIKNN